MGGSIVLRGRALVGRSVRADVVVSVVDGRIDSVVPATAGGREERLADDLLLAPGFVDGHIHGSGGADVMGGVDAIRHVAETIAARGVTSFVPSSVAAPLDVVRSFAADVRDATTWAEPAVATVLGAHLEGPALDPGHKGAHDPTALVDPAVVADAFRRTPDAWSAVRTVTLAPERPGGLDLVRLLAARRIVASVGHSGATFDEARAAYDAGARSTTHLFNAMTGIAHRAPGMALAALLDPRPAVELIADGVHVDRALWPLVRALAGSRVVLVSDALAAAYAADGRYRLGGLDLVVADGRATLLDGTLAGSTITLADAVARFVASGATVADAVLAASTRPTRLVGARRKGRIAPGADADLVALREDGTVARVWRAGTELVRT